MQQLSVHLDECFSDAMAAEAKRQQDAVVGILHEILPDQFSYDFEVGVTSSGQGCFILKLRSPEGNLFIGVALQHPNEESDVRHAFKIALERAVCEWYLSEQAEDFSLDYVRNVHRRLYHSFREKQHKSELQNQPTDIKAELAVKAEQALSFCPVEDSHD